jgi:site-specific recombinase XerD
MGNKSEIDLLRQEFLEYIEIEKGRSVKTVENYDHYLSRFFSEQNIKGVKDITDRAIREFRLWLNRQNTTKNIGGRLTSGTLKKRTQNYYLIALRSFLKFLLKRGYKTVAPDQIELAKVSERSIDLITNDELSRIINGPKGSDLKNLRDKAILELLFSTGLRVSELCSLNREVDLSRGEFSIRGKGDKSVWFLFPIKPKKL